MLDLRGLLPTRPGRPYYLRPLDGITGLTIHYTASAPQAGKDAVRAIAQYQVGPNAQEDFPGIAYTLVVPSDGTAYICHDLAVRTWHSGAVVDGIARNASHVGVAYIGDYQPNAAQLSGLAAAIGWVQAQLGRALTVEGHQSSYPTECPGKDWPIWKQQLLELIS